MEAKGDVLIEGVSDHKKILVIGPSLCELDQLVALLQGPLVGLGAREKGAVVPAKDGLVLDEGQELAAMRKSLGPTVKDRRQRLNREPSARALTVKR